MPGTIPERMRALLLHALDKDIERALAGLEVAELPVPVPRRGQVLVRIEAAPCNPSDLLLLQGKYGSLKTAPFVPGWEGAGRVVASGGGMLSRWLLGKRVACGLQGDRNGTWAQYAVANVTECIPLQRALGVEQGASLIINPLTALGLLDTARRHGHRAAIHTAGASQVGRMLLAMSRNLDYPMIHVVRRAAQVELLHSLGASHVLNSSEVDFVDQLRELAARLKATIAFEAVAGNLTATVLNCLPPRSTVFLYGSLSEEPCDGMNPSDFIFHGKTVTGFLLPHWLERHSLLRILWLARRAQNMIIRGEISTLVQRRVSLDQAATGLQHYVRHMTEGKVLIVPHG